MTPHHPVVVAHRRKRAESLQLRIADGITKYAGSMAFVYVHAAHRRAQPDSVGLDEPDRGPVRRTRQHR